MRALVVALTMVASVAFAQEPAVHEGDFVLKDFRFASGETLPELRLHYRTLGKLQRDARGVARNAVLIMHGTGGTGAQFLRPEFSGELFRAGGELDTARFFVILPDGIGHGKSSKPSDSLRARFPHYGYEDMIAAQYRLVTEGLGVQHLRLVMGTSMGGMHTWLWGQRYPDAMDALLPLASLPAQISGRNRAWRRIAIDAIRLDPQWRGGDYREQPPGLRTAEQMLFLMGSNPVLRQQQMPDLAKSDAVFDSAVTDSLRGADANDVAVPARSFARLRSRAGAGEDPRAARRDQFRGRPHQSAGARHPRARDQARAARPRSRDPHDTAIARPRHAHRCRSLEGAPRRAAAQLGP